MKEAESNHRLTMIVVVMLATVFSSFTLWLMDSWIKYPLFMLEILTIIVLHLIFNGYDLKLSVLNHIKIKSLDVHLPIIDVLLMVSAASLLLFNVLHAQGGSISLVLALFTTSILPGYALLNVFGLNHYFSKLENMVLSYILSYVFTGFMTFVLLFASENTRVLGVLSSYILIGLISALKRRKEKTFSTPRSLAKNIDSLGILVTITFFALSFYFMYPGFALLTRTDISQHYGLSIVLGRTPDLYIGSTYLFAHLHESMFIALSNPSLVSTQTSLLMLNFMLPLAFYIMAKSYLEKIDARLPSLATIFWVLFTNSFGGFAWLYFANLKLSSLGQTQLQLLSVTADKTYNGTVYGILGLWYFPATVSFVLLMAAILLMSKKEVPTSKYLVLFSITIATLYLTHVTEAVVFTLFLAIYGTISKNTNLKIDASIKASIIGLALAAIVYYALSQFTARFIFNLPLLFSLALPVLVLTLSLIVKNFVSPRLPPIKFRDRIHLKSALKLLMLPLIFTYIVALLSWVSFVDVFHTWQVDAIGVVPWFIYPLMLGINGLLAILSLYFLTQDTESYKPLGFFIAFMVFAFIAGKLVSMLNLYFFNVDYWEKRFMWFIKPSLAILAPISVLLLIDRLRKHVHANVKTVISIAMIGTVVLCGISTTFLNVEYWNITATNPANYPSSVEQSAVDAFKKILDSDPRAWAVTVTSASAATATLAAPADMLVLKQLLYTAYTPEMAFTQLYRFPAYSHPYIYIHDRDLAYLDKSTDQLLAKYLSTLPIVFNNSEVKIYNVSKPSFPQPNSENVLIIPFDKSVDEQNLIMAYYILSQGFYNYTVAYDLDHKALNATTVVLSFDPPEQNILTNTFQDAFNQTLNSWSPSTGNWRIENGQLMGGENGNYGERIILSPISAENFTATVKVKPQNGNATVANYASFVYSWLDSKNYRIADILFNSDGYIYILFRNFINGVETDFPQWPGTKTDLKWDFNNEYSVKLNVNGTLNEVSINNATLLSSNSENIHGKIGLSYYRLYEVSFDNFSVDYATQVNLRPVTDYLEYLHSGGRIIVLNTNGDGFLAKELFSISNSTTEVQKIQGNATKINLPYALSAPLITAENYNVTTISRYVGSVDEVPFILRRDYDNGGELFYVNVYPIIQAMQNSDNQSKFYELLGKLLNDLNLTKLDPTISPLSNFDGYVKEIYLKNDVKIETNSMLFPLKSEIEKAEVAAGSSSYVFYNVTNLAISDYSNAIIETDDTVVQNGNGLYTEFQLNSTFSIRPSAGSMNLKISVDNETSDLSNVSLLSVTPSTGLQLQIRTPAISAFEVTFIEFYLQKSKQLTTQIYGQDLNVTGFTEFSIILSDSYNALNSVELGASFQGNPQASPYTLSSTLPTAIFWALILLPIFMSIILIFKFRKSSENARANSLRRIDHNKVTKSRE